MSLYALMVFFHISAAFLLLSTSIVGEPLIRAAARRTGSVHELRAYLAIGRPMARLSPVAAMLVLATGIYLASVGRFWALGWVQASTAFWLINSIVAVAVVRRAVDRLDEEVSATTDAVVGSGLDRLRWAPAWSWGPDLVAANDAVMLALMTLRPSLGGSLLLFVLTNVAVAGGRVAFGLDRPRRTPVPGVSRS
ncbi:MAG: hypothetical protein GWM90_11040 [Gemmatimonadetes bacterium]|nr:hypothetical protein [Gemmatimonadota bacterium]NIQ54496.1 hypothetical protein [Gemmatimonadota bacterium]NIU74702.1 hypothetical protein [Gammaproteobacteria bacterium]NIX44627.1 hypothetical protein [Gemmatimonadota bacterium]NIY08852.1 hypothetical protein [Gemmatimonadota bacterium]